MKKQKTRLALSTTTLRSLSAETQLAKIGGGGVSATQRVCSNESLAACSESCNPLTRPLGGCP